MRCSESVLGRWEHNLLSAFFKSVCYYCCNSIMIATDQVPTVSDVTTSAQSVSRSYCGEIIHCQFCWICSCGNETISYFYEWTQQIYSLHLCRSMGHTGTLLLCFMVGVLITSEQYFWTYFGKYSAGKHNMECKLLPVCLCFLEITSVV